MWWCQEWGLWEVMSPGVEPPWWVSALIQETPESPCPLPPVRTQWENTICEPGSGFSPESKFSRSLIVDLQPPEMWEADFYGYNSCLQCSVMTAQANQDTSSVQSLSHVRLWPHGLQHTRPPCPSLPPRACSNSCPLSRGCHPTISFSVSPFSSRLSSFLASGSCQWVSSLHQVAKVLQFQLQHQSFQWIFRTDFLWDGPLDLLAVQGTLKSFLQHHSSKVWILWHSAFFIVQLSHPYTTTGKTTALTRWTFVNKVMSLLFNMLSKLVITFLPRSKRLLTSSLQSPSAVILKPQKIKSVTVFTVSPSICHEVMGQGAMTFVLWMFHLRQEPL